MAMHPNYLLFAETNARREFERWRKSTWTHWSYWDEPTKALCGKRIEPEEFNRTPSCPDCLAALQRMQDEDIR